MTQRVPVTVNQEGRSETFDAVAAGVEGDLIVCPSGEVGLVHGMGESFEIGDKITAHVRAQVTANNDGTARTAGTLVGWDATAKTLTATTAGDFDIGTVVEDTPSGGTGTEVSLNQGL